jgi:hypothetical protein
MKFYVLRLVIWLPNEVNKISENMWPNLTNCQMCNFYLKNDFSSRTQNIHNK